jgi:pyrimidine deaminase RibD-like protein
MRDAYTTAYNAQQDAEREYLQQASDQAEAEAPRNECECCRDYGRGPACNPAMVGN